MVTICRIGLMTTEPHAISDPALARRLLDTAIAQGAARAILRSDSQLDLVAAVASPAASDAEVVAVEGPDTLPYEPVAPSPGVAGSRSLALERPATEPHLVLPTAAARLGQLPLSPLLRISSSVG